MMNKKGFTLVELMVVIVIIGVLAAVAMPKFADAINKSRASEAPNIIGQIGSAEAVYQAEVGDYLALTFDQEAQFLSSLGVNTVSNFFHYQVVARGLISTGFTASAITGGTTGKTIGTGFTITLNESSGKENTATDGLKFIPVWQ